MRGLGIFTEARTPTPVLLNEIIYLRVGRVPEKGYGLSWLSHCGCGWVNYSQCIAQGQEG